MATQFLRLWPFGPKSARAVTLKDLREEIKKLEDKLMAKTNDTVARLVALNAAVVTMGEEFKGGLTKVLGESQKQNTKIDELKKLLEDADVSPEIEAKVAE